MAINTLSLGTQALPIMFEYQDNISRMEPFCSELNTDLPPSVSLNIASITESSAAVVSRPQKAAKSLAIRPLAITSEPRFTVPAQSGIYRRVESSSISATLHSG